MTSRTIETVRAFLASNHMFVEEEWLTGCVEYLIETSGNNLNVVEMQNLAMEQWLLNDLKDVCPGCLPPNIAAQTKTVLNGRYVLQVNAAIDIGTSLYQQYLRIQKVNMENVEATTSNEDKVPSQRMIKLYMTDGEQDIAAIEYRPIRNLNCYITPGSKVLIKGPVDCRRGIIMLTESAFEPLGGDVEDLVTSNSYPVLLATKLGLPIPQDGRKISELRNIDIPTPPSEVPTSSSNQTLERNTGPTSTDIKVEEVDDDIGMDQINALEALLDPISSNPSKDAKPKNRRDIENKVSGVLDSESVKRKSLSEYEMPEKKLKVDTPDDYYPDEIDMMYDENDELLKQIDIEMDIYEMEPGDRGPKVVNSDPFVYIKQINDLSEDEKRGRVFRVKAQIMKLLSKLTVSKDSWCLKCTLVDGTGSLDVEFTSEVLSKVVGYTPQEMNRLKKDMATNAQLKETVISALKKAKETLQVLYCIIVIAIQDVVRITELIPFDSVHVGLLKKRVENAGL